MDNVKDAEVKELAVKAGEELRLKAAALQTLQDDVSAMQATVCSRQEERLKFSGQFQRAEEVAPLVEATAALRASLEGRRRHLQQLRDGTAEEGLGLEALRSRLREMEQCRSAAGREEVVSDVRRLETAFSETEELCRNAGKEIDKAQAEVSSLEAQLSDLSAAAGRKRGPRSLNQQLDRLILHSCREVGLQL